MAEIELTRAPGFRVDRLREYRIFIDRKRVGSIKTGETKLFALPPGPHELQLKEDWASSEKLQVNLGSNDRAQFVCAPRVKQNDEGLITGVRLIYWMTIGCRRYIDLRPGTELAVEGDPTLKLYGLDGPKVFGIALLISILFWALTGQSIVVVGAIVGALSVVLSGLIARGIGRAAVHLTEEVQKRRDD